MLSPHPTGPQAHQRYMRHKPQAYANYRKVAVTDRTVVAACSEVGCVAWAKGWDTAVDERTSLGMGQAAYIRSGQHGRTWRELPGRTADGFTVFRFEPHQRCFAEHRTIPERWGVQAGTLWVPGPMVREHTRAEDWFEDLHDHMDRVWTAKNKG